MNINKIEKLHRKIGQLITSIREDDAPSAIERDLLKSYIRDMYEYVIFDKKKLTPAQDSRKIEERQIVENKIPEPTVVQSSNQGFSMDQVIKKEVKDQSTSETVQNIPAAQVPNVELDQTASPIEIPEELEELFAHADVNELSDRLSRTPIEDLTRCMGINEKIFTMNELFGGDSSLFNNTMSDLNKMDSLDQAKEYLVEKVALNQGWSEPGKIKKADKFIKLISRRYN